MRKKWLKKVMLLVALGLVIFLLVSTGGFVLFQGTPEWYIPEGRGTVEERAEAAKRAEDKFAEVQNWAAAIRAEEQGPEYAVTSRPTDGAASTVTFTEDELNAFFHKWADWYGWNERFGKYLENPMIVLRENRLILAGTVKDLHTVASFHFEPRLAENGELEMNLVRVLGGKLPMPDAVWSSQRDKVERVLLGRLPTWQRTATFDSAGGANDDAIKSAAAKLVMNMLHYETSDSVMFLPLVSGQKVPVQLTHIQIENRSLTLTARRLDSRERKDYLTRLKEPFGSANAAAGE